jgi:hypothetical protein
MPPYLIIVIFIKIKAVDKLFLFFRQVTCKNMLGLFLNTNVGSVREKNHLQGYYKDVVIRGFSCKIAI